MLKKLTKVKSENQVFHPTHPVKVNSSSTRDILVDPKVGQSFIFGNNITSTVVEIIDGETFRTNNSVYKLEDVQVHIMIDIECLGIEPGAPVLSIAAIRFTLDGQYVDSKDKGFYEKISLKDSLDNYGLKVDSDTLKWWADQDNFKDQLVGGKPLTKVLGALRKFIDKEAMVWGNGARFDLGHIAFQYSLTEHAIPWRFSNERDVRTIVMLNPSIKKDLKFFGTKHDPWDDCIHQILYLTETYSNVTS